VVRNVNSAMTLAYFRIGKMIVEDEQDGNERAGYAQDTIARLSQELSRGFGRGYPIDNLDDSENSSCYIKIEFPNQRLGNLKALLN